MNSVASSSEQTAAAWRWLQQELKGRALGSLVVLVGLGDGHLLDALDEHAPATRVLAIEPDPASTRRFLARRSSDAWARSGRLVYLADPEYAGFNEAWRLFPSDGGLPPVFTHPELVRCDGIGRAKDVLKRILFGVQANADARRRMAPTYLANSIRNVPAIVRGTDVRTLTDGYRGVPAVVVGAGPSLDHSLATLKALADRALVISTDTAFRPLLTAGIEPSLVVGMDPSPLNLRHFLSLPRHRHTWLIAESALDPQAVAAFDDRTFWFRVAHHHPWPWLNAIGLDVGRLDVWGSVLTGAFQAACLAGCDPIVFVGADLAYTDRRPYARATTYEFNWAQGVAEGADLQRLWANQMASPNACEASDLRGRPTMTTETLLSYRDWLLARARRSGRRIINASAAGILTGDGIAHLPLGQILRDRIPLKSVASFAQPPVTLQPAGVASRLRALIPVVSGLRRTGVMAGFGRTSETSALEASPSPVSDWVEFCGGGFNSAAVAPALDAAVDGLERGREGLERGTEQVPAVWSNFWSRCMRHALVRSTLTQLPEAHRAEAPIAVSDRATLLREALHLLDEIRTEVMRADDVSPIGDVVSNPVSTAYAWPETTRWAILTFEALLGRVGAPARPRSRSLFGGAVRFAGLKRAEIDLSEPPTAVHACTTLAEQWLSCVASLDRSDAAVLRGLLVPHMMAAVLPPDVSTADRARLLAGTLRTCVPNSRLLMRPRVLTDEGVDRAIVQYETAGGAVCLTPHSCETFILRENGSRGRAHAWPRSISGEIAWGTDGIVAWSSGCGNPPHVVPPYVMYRRRASDEPSIQELVTHGLPIRPTTGTWLDGRLYWICLPAPGETWHGIASLAPGAPGEEPVLELSGEVPIDIHVSDGDLMLEPCVRRADFGLQRQRVSHGWRWRRNEPDTSPRRLGLRSLGPYGASSSRSSQNGWTAHAHPEADAVRLASSAGAELTLNCYYPYKLAWIGRSLLVSTIERELLLFEGLADALEECR